MATIPLTDQAAPGFDDPLGMLVACHRRIERQLATLARLQRHLPENGSDADARAAARATLKYFDNAAPNHDADEEQSLFPRLTAATPDAIPLVDDLEREHAMIAERWRRLRPMLVGISAGQRSTLSPKEVANLADCYHAHIAREESDLLPFAKTIFDAATLVVIGEEMAARRGVDPTVPQRRSSGVSGERGAPGA
jgi:hemerythrin-like domain-containing protein